MTCPHRPRWPNGHMVESLSLSLSLNFLRLELLDTIIVIIPSDQSVWVDCLQRDADSNHCKHNQSCHLAGQVGSAYPKLSLDIAVPNPRSRIALLAGISFIKLAGAILSWH